MGLFRKDTELSWLQLLRQNNYEMIEKLGYLISLCRQAAPISHELEAPPAALVLAGRNDATHCCVTVTETCECEKRTKQKNEQRKATYRPPSHGVKPGAGGGGGGGGGGEKDFFAALLWGRWC